MSLPGDQAACQGTYVAQDFLDDCTGVVFLPLLWICCLAQLSYVPSAAAESLYPAVCADDISDI